MFDPIIGRPVPLQPVDVDAPAVDVAHVELVAILGGIGVAVEEVDAAVGGLLVLVIDDRFKPPGIRRIGAPLPVVITRLGEVPEVIDHAGRDESRAVVVPGDAPGVARALRKEFEVARPGMDPEERGGEVEGLAAMLHDRAVEDAVEPVEPAVRPPGERIRQLVRVVASETGQHDLPGVGLAVAVGVLEEEEVGRVDDPDAPPADRDPRGYVQTFGEDGELVHSAVAVGIFEDLDPVAARPRRLPRVFEALGHPDAALLVEGHRDGIDEIRLARDHLDREPGRHRHRPRRVLGRPRVVGRPILVVGDRLFLLGSGGRGACGECEGQHQPFPHRRLSWRGHRQSDGSGDD